MTKKVFSLSIVLIFILCSSFTNKEHLNIPDSDNTYINYGIPLHQILPPPINRNDFSILVQKSSYTLFLKYRGRLVKSYPCVFGPDPINDKLQQGDNRTPEGNFTITEITEHFLWGYFLAFDYPNYNSWEKHNVAKTYGVLSPTADIGGDVGIHGVVDGLESYIDTKNNWTEGCVAMKNVDVRELAQNISAGTPIKIIY